MTPAPRLLLAAAFALVVTGPALLLAGPASAAACAPGTGVTVVVQFPDGHTEEGCASGDPATGLEALSAAGFTYSFHAQNPGFVCRIAGAPADGRCMKPSYWSYWHSEGGAWRYSNVGAASYDPEPGSTEGWRFGRGTAPGAAANPPKATPTRAPSKAPTRKPAASSRPSASASSTPSSTPSASVSASATPSASATAKESASPSAIAGDDTSPVSAPTAEGGDPSSGTVSWGWGVGALALIAALGGAAALVRRRAG